MKSMKELTAPCGLDCFNCIVYEKNITDAVRAMVAQGLNIPESKVDCRGCREQKGCVLHVSPCATYDCVKTKNVEFCFECAEFPCVKLQPAADGAGTYPHNIKVYNLGRMKQVGVEQWAEKEASEIRRRYFKGTFVPGTGPVMK